MIKLVSFDVWNTLLRIDEMFRAVSKGISEVLEIGVESAKQFLYQSYAEAKRLRRLGELDEVKAVEVSQKLLAERLSTSIDSIRRGIARALLYIDPDSILYTDTVETLEALSKKGIAMAIIGNTLFWSSSYTRHILEKIGIAKHFRIQVYADEVGVSKPDRRIFTYLCKTLGIEPENAVHVGDGVVEDLGGALSAGMKAVLVKRGSSDMYVVREAGIAVIPRLTDLLTVIDIL